MKLPSQKTALSIGAALTLVLLASVGHTIWNFGNNTGYAPEQPLPFSHQLHAGQYQIPCAYCHVGTEKSRVASVPAMNVCMNCHQVVKPDSPHIQKLKDMYQKNENIPWVKVHDLPDYVRFTHERHINAGVDCANCHGDVKNMKKIEQVKSLQMGFCLDCHRKPEVNAPIQCQSCHY